MSNDSNPSLPSRKKRISFNGINLPNYEFIINCMHCGLCLPICPTYSITGLEKSSPRGRIRLIKSVADGELDITPGFVKEMQFCLDCQACETACPAGVKYGSLVEAARAQIFQQGYESVLSRWIKIIALDWMFAQQARLQLFSKLLRLYQISGLRFLVERTRILKLFSKKFHDIQGLTPEISPKFSVSLLPLKSTPHGKARFRVGFLPGCIMDVAYADVNVDTVKLLLHHQCEVIVPRNLACCGSLQAHYGMIETAKKFARHNIELFAKEELDYIVMNSAGCGAYMKEYGHLFDDEPELTEKAKNISTKVKDITEFLFMIGFQGGGRPAVKHKYAGKRVTYHDACHLAHTQKIVQQPRELLKSITSYEFVELPEANWCCGSAGIYNIVQHESSMELLKRKIDNIKSIKPDVVVTANPGCMVQIQYGLRKEGIDIELVHTATFLKNVCID
jgi:glycolate oxidase iron-sulfur subunit